GGRGGFPDTPGTRKVLRQARVRGAYAARIRLLVDPRRTPRVEWTNATDTLRSRSKGGSMAAAEKDSLIREFFIFLKEEKKWWLGPVVVLLLGLSAVIIFAEGSSIA